VSHNQWTILPLCMDSNSPASAACVGLCRDRKSLKECTGDSDKQRAIAETRVVFPDPVAPTIGMRGGPKSTIHSRRLACLSGSSGTNSHVHSSSLSVGVSVKQIVSWSGSSISQDTLALGTVRPFGQPVGHEIQTTSGRVRWAGNLAAMHRGTDASVAACAATLGLLPYIQAIRQFFHHFPALRGSEARIFQQPSSNPSLSKSRIRSRSAVLGSCMLS